MNGRTGFWMAALICAGQFGFAKTFDIASFGAVPDSTTDNTEAIQKAVDACEAAGGGTVAVSGGVFMTYTVKLKSNVRLDIERGSTLKGGPDPLKYPEFGPSKFWKPERVPRFNKRAMFYAEGVHNIAVTGGGTIDGSAELFHEQVNGKWQRKSDTLITGRNLMIVGCRDVELSDILIYHPSGWSMWILDCDRVHINRLRVETHRDYPNGDGIHLGGCRDVTVSDCLIDSEDDSLILRSHQEQMLVPRPLERVTVANCVLRSSRACMVRFGWSEDYEIKDCVLSNIVSPYSDLGIGIFLPQINPKHNIDPPRSDTVPAPPQETIKPFAVENIRFENIVMTTPRAPFQIFFAPDAQVRCVRDLYFSNMRMISGRSPEIKVRPQDHVSGLHFSNVIFDIRRPASVTNAPMCTGFGNTTDVTFDNVRFSDTIEETTKE